ncbi:hypothetical protein H257_15944 [Aphanomyces astaci]|uniref:Uncharacterized protein n=1 Tax=Aphanomyces astaci TaxID=112090 RepID=W4FMR2_APHAT|nr:hypothetical protein H257_15944 [Aphanomyces astaci]ETV67978.1 hypothetical protein H257_15944 [Aphanomyces astaci]|eukprot:XP_009842541.1 hypothetical protein H257_15944 [Aphanomyces astaci]
MKDHLREWITEQPALKAKHLFTKLEAAHARGEFGDVPLPSLAQVQEVVKYITKKFMIHASTVAAVQAVIVQHGMPDHADDANAHEPFVFGVATDNGVTTFDLLHQYRAACLGNPDVRILCHVDTTFKTNKSGLSS